MIREILEEIKTDLVEIWRELPIDEKVEIIRLLLLTQQQIDSCYMKRKDTI